MKKLLIAIIIIGLVVAGVLYISKMPTTPGVTIVDTGPKLLSTVNYACNEGKTITASFYEGTTTAATTMGEQPQPTGSAKVLLSDGRSLDLHQTISADGNRYANQDESFVFWGKGNGALVLENNAEKSYIGCIKVVDMPQGSNLSQIYQNGSLGITMRFPSIVTSTSKGYPESYKVDESFYYQLSPKTKIYGVKFTVPEAMATGTNLSSDTYMSVESIPKVQTCSANLFLDGAPRAATTTDNGVTYSMATSSGAGAGNRYEETVYAFPGTNPCLAIRYLVHYGVFENYPEGTVKEFNKQDLMNAFDAIRRTLVVNQ